jgi:hypothetical protein
MFKKKFKVRIACHSAGLYMVEYAYYRICPNWTSLKYWYSPLYSYPALAQWERKLYTVEKAEKVAEGLKSVADVMAYYAPQEENEHKWRVGYAKWRNERTPYQVKRIL